MPVDYLSSIHPREQSVFIATLKLEDPSARAAFLVKECGYDIHLRTRVSKLLAAVSADCRIQVNTESK